ncbi:hypothetical protein E2542_SST17333 [Spatholobus suberectus]|nr:hypothetical protein E2542_SST17333 [Spatholobus suberectus]
MAYKNRNRNNYGWPYPSDEYPVYDPPVEAKYPKHHKGRVAFGTNYEDTDQVEANVDAREQRYESTRFGNHNAFKSVDQEAEAFIQYEHNRMELARLMSTRGA